MSRYEVIESKAWRCDDGRTASIYGAQPWTSVLEAERWKIEPRGFTVRDNVSGTVGIGRAPWPTRAEAQAWVDSANADYEGRLKESAAARARAPKQALTPYEARRQSKKKRRS